MNLKLLQEVISDYKKHLLNSESTDWLLPYQATKTWKYHWNMEELDFLKMYDDSLSGDSPIWEGDDYHPKHMMLKYIEMNSDLARSAFIDLFDQKREIVGRIHRFIYILNELKNVYQGEHQQYDTHYHDDRVMILNYLAFNQPEAYTMYEKSGFEKLLKLVGAKDIKKSHDLGRYVKVAKTVNIFVQKDEELVAHIASGTADDNHYNEPNLLAVSGLLKYVAER